MFDCDCENVLIGFEHTETPLTETSVSHNLKSLDLEDSPQWSIRVRAAFACQIRDMDGGFHSDHHSDTVTLSPT